jgi:hypothetical protein
MMIGVDRSPGASGPGLSTIIRCKYAARSQRDNINRHSIFSECAQAIGVRRLRSEKTSTCKRSSAELARRSCSCCRALGLKGLRKLRSLGPLIRPWRSPGHDGLTQTEKPVSKSRNIIRAPRADKKMKALFFRGAALMPRPLSAPPTVRPAGTSIALSVQRSRLGQCSHCGSGPGQAVIR